jgi:uncharacterized membrane-anchored protein YitT (DUF2179 family)
MSKNYEHHYSIRHDIINWIYALLGILFSTFALNCFFLPNHFLDGGVTGISLLIHEVTNINIAIVIIICNLPFLIMGAYQINRRFAYRSLLCVILFALALWLVPIVKVTDDKVMVSIFGGFFLGVGIGLGMRGGFALDGIEVLALYTIKRSSFKITEVILGINVVVFVIAAFYLGLPIALYAMLTYYVATRTIDYVVEGLDEYTGVTIISSESEIIKEKLVKEFGRGITIYKGEKGFLKDSFEVSYPCDIIFTICTRFEVRQMRLMVHAMDPKAFVYTNAINEIAGGVMKKVHHQH